MGIVDNPSPLEVAGHFKEVQSKIDTDLTAGLTVWVAENDLGSTAVYNANPSGEWFLAKKTIINGQVVSQEISGHYDVSGHQISTMISQDVGSPYLTCRLFLDGILVGSQADPFSWANAQADSFLRSKVEGEGDDPSRLDATLQDERSPYPFALKTLRDFARSQVDTSRTQTMYENLSKGKQKVVWNRDYQA